MCICMVLLCIYFLGYASSGLRLYTHFSIQGLSGGNKWSNFVKLLKKYPQLDEVFGHELTDSQKSELSAVEQLIMEIPNIIHHHSNCYNTLSK